jgi:hypothetical protein
VYESLLHLLRASVPEFLGSLMAASVLTAFGWTVRNLRERSRPRRDDALPLADETGDDTEPPSRYNAMKGAVSERLTAPFCRRRRLGPRVCVGGLVLDVPAKSLPSLVEWTLNEARLGASRLDESGRDADPLLVLTETALERYGLPTRLSKEERLAGRILDSHKTVKQLVRAEWKLMQRGLGPWARIYRPAEGHRRYCVQLCIPSWDALDTRHWGNAGQLPPAELARLLGAYGTRVMTPRGCTAVTGLELMTARHPPTRADEPAHGFQGPPVESAAARVRRRAGRAWVRGGRRGWRGRGRRRCR